MDIQTQLLTYKIGYPSFNGQKLGIIGKEDTPGWAIKNRRI